MRRFWHAIGSVQRILLTLSATTALAASACLAFVLVVSSGDDGTAAADRPLPPLAPGAVDPGTPVPLLLLRSAPTADWFARAGGEPGSYDRMVDAWEARLRALGHEVARIDDAALARGIDVPDVVPRPVIVAPAPAALDDAAVAALQDAVRRGAGLIATWQLAIHRPDGSWRGYAPLTALVGATPLAPADAGAVGTPRYATLLGGTALTANLPAGARLEVQPADVPLLVTAPGAVADWTRWEMLPFGEDAHPVRPTAIAQAAVARGRVVWMDFDPAGLVAAGPGRGWVETLVAQSVRWTAGEPLAEIATWPGGVRTAAMLSMDTEHRFDAARGVAQRFADAGMPLTAFAVSSLATGHADTVQALAAAGEVGSHTDDHRPLAGRPFAEQVEQLTRSRDVLSALADAPVVGFRPPEEETDAETAQALVQAGYRYLAGPRDKNRAEPFVEDVDGTPLVVLPRIPRDDFEFVVRNPLDPAGTWTAIQRDFQQVRRLGGLYLFDFHTQYAEEPGSADAVRHLLGLRALPDVWAATGRDVARWWALRAGAKVRVARPQPTRLVVTVTATQAVEGLTVLVHLPVDRPVAHLLASPGGAAPLLATTAPGTIRLVFEALAADAERRVDLTLQPGS
jgi:peptidoglycan/xylan/chitin deacetylase (PgdA/CDA1 family)